MLDKKLKKCLYCNGKIIKRHKIEICQDCKRIFWTITQYEALTGKRLARDGEVKA